MQLKISDALNMIINFAREESMRTGSYSIGPDHLFLGLLRHGDNSACEALRSLDTDLQELKQFIDGKIFTNEHIPYSELDRIGLSRMSHNVISIAALESTRLRASSVNPSHLLLSLCRCQGCYGQTYLRDTGVEYGRIFSFFENSGIIDSERLSDDGARENAIPDGSPVPEDNNGSGDPLEEFGLDLTSAAENGTLDPLVGRDSEMERVIQILGRRRKNNPMLVGEPGVGKSAIVEGLAQRIVSGDVPSALVGKRLVSLDIASVVAGTRYRGDFEKRLKELISSLRDRRDVILFIDEFHTLVGAGGSSGSLDAANMLKPALARGDIQCIGATTIDEFSKVVEKDGALDRRFQKVVIEPSDEPATVEILERLKEIYEKHHGLRYAPEALRACVTLSERYITDRCLPDKAIDVMDEAGSMVSIKRGGRRKSGEVVSPEDVATVISNMTGIPVNKVAESESLRLVRMADRLKKRVIGQDEAISKVVGAIRRNRAGIKDPHRPIGSFMFFGPTGVGKTQLAKSLAELLFDSENNMVRVDMSEYTEKFNTSRLIGAPPGYVGFEEGGQLSEKVRHKPYCVVLLDEIEKAHPDVFNLLLQVLDEGRLTDSNGRTVNFRNTILIMTSNVGSREIDDFGNGVGFSTASSGGNDAVRKRAMMEKAVRKSFSPEFINRVDERIFFNPLSREDIERIVSIELKNLKARVLEAGYRLEVKAGAKRFVADAGYDPNYGARPLKRAVQKYLEDPISEFIIRDRMLKRGRASATDIIRVGLSRNKESLDIVKVPAESENHPETDSKSKD